MVYRCLILLAVFFLLISCSSPPRLSVHEQLRQHLLEAEYGSAISIHFAKKPITPLPASTSEKQLLHQLSAQAPASRWSAAGQLAYSQNKNVVYALVNAMLDPAGTKRVCVMASALGHLKDPRTLGALSQAAFDPGNRDLRLCAIRALGVLGSRQAVPNLIKALKQRNMPVQAARSLAQLGDKRAVKALIEAAADKSIRVWMLGSLGELGSKAALPYLQQQLSASRRTEKSIISEAIWKIQQLSATNSNQRLADILLHDTNVAHKNWATFRLGDLKTSTSVAALITALDSGTLAAVKGRAAAALVRLGKTARLSVSAALKKSPVDKYLLAAAGYIVKPSDISSLQRLKEPDNQSVKTTINESVKLIKRRFQLSKR